MLNEETSKVRGKGHIKREINLEESEKVISWYANIVELINRYGISKLLQAFSLIVLTVSFLMFANAFHNEEVIEKWLVEKEKAHDDGTKMRNEINPEVNKLLIKLLYEVGADRACVIEMHNGKENPTSLPFNFCDMTYEQTRERVPYISDEYENLNMSKYTFPYYVYSNSYYIGDVESVFQIDKRLAMRLEVNDVKYIGMIIIRGTSDIGFLMVSFFEKPEISDEKLRSVLIYYVQEVGFYLDYAARVNNKK